MSDPYAPVPGPPEPVLGGGWALRATDPLRPVTRTSRGWSVVRDGTPLLELTLHRVLHHPLRHCYPVGAHDLAVELSGGSARTEPAAAELLRALVPALFRADPECRRVISAPDADDTETIRRFEANGFRAITDADLEGRTVVLLAAEPAALAGLSTALNDMPH
ncbi:GNAT family N-acetyltransferase [Streptomyces sp. NPDC057137]|uniref:GNAT family N-acetyltransferase n=1 Tax=Streptomyces sp. NPDC057137 TaxID=3346030 RepID=UPI003638B68D